MPSDSGGEVPNDRYPHFRIEPTPAMKKLPAPIKKKGQRRLPIKSGKTSSWDLARAAKQIYDSASIKPTIFVDERIYFKIEFTNDIWLPNVR